MQIANELHVLVDVPESSLRVTRRVLEAFATEWDVPDAESEEKFTDQARRDVEAAEDYFDRGGQGIPHEEILRECGVR